MDNILFQIFKIILIILNTPEKHETVTHNPSKMIYVNKKEKIITFKIKTGYNLELLMPETMKLLGSTKSKIV